MKIINSKRARWAVASVAAISAIGVAGAVPAHATTWEPRGSYEVTVPESSDGEPVYLELKAGDEARISCSGSVWGGVWFTGSNGPNGWADAAPSNFPMPGSRGGRSFAAITRFKSASGATTSWQRAGTSSYHGVPFDSRMEMRVNDNAPGNGNGAFTCTVRRYVRVS